MEGSGRAGWNDPSGSLASLTAKTSVPGIAAALPFTHLSTTPVLHDKNRAFLIEILLHLVTDPGNCALSMYHQRG